MFSIICNSGRKPASSSQGERKPGMMSCCQVQTGRRPQHKWWQGTSGCLGSGALLVLLPKCPMCIAAYLALWTGAGVAMPVAMHLRPILAILFLASALWLAIRWAAVRRGRTPKKPAAKVLPGTTSIKPVDLKFPDLLRREYRPKRGVRAFGFPAEVESIPQSPLHKVGNEVKEHGLATRRSYSWHAAEHSLRGEHAKLFPAPGYRYVSVFHVGISHLLE
jgi:hypothetical protein